MLVLVAGALAPTQPASAKTPAGIPTSPPAPGEAIPPIKSVLLRPFEAPTTPWGAGHRGVDLEVEPGTSWLQAPIDGTLTTGVTVGNRYATIETQNASMRMTLSYLSSVAVANNSQVKAGDLIAVAGVGHGDGHLADPHVHFSARLPDLTDPSGWRYVDPMPYVRRYLRRVRGPVTRVTI